MERSSVGEEAWGAEDRQKKNHLNRGDNNGGIQLKGKYGFLPEAAKE